MGLVGFFLGYCCDSPGSGRCKGIQQVSGIERHNLQPPGVTEL